jgi:ribosomal protein S27AE
MMIDAPKGKACPKCGEPMSDLATQFERHCTNGKCQATWPWELKPGQKPLISSSRDRRGTA